MEEEYDLIIIGGGYGGLIAALNAARGGYKKILMVEKRGIIGGTCLFEGCIASKALLSCSEKVHDAKVKFPKFFVESKDVQFDNNKIIERKDALLELMGGNNMKKTKELGIDMAKGWGKLKSSTEVEVHNEGKVTCYKGKKIVLNMGGESTTLPGNVIPVDHKLVILSEDALNLKKLPKKMIIIGAGFIGLELGSHFNRLGVDVTLIEFFDRILPLADKQLSAEMKPILEKQGMKFMLSHKVTGGKVNEKDSNVTCIVEDAPAGGNTQEIVADMVFICTGRRALTRDCGLEEAGVKLDRFGRCEIDDNMETTLKGVFAIGDITNRGPQLAHKAEDEALAMVDKWFGRETHLSYNSIPMTVFTSPEVASVGKTEEQLIAEKIDYKRGISKIGFNPRGRCLGEEDGFIKVLADRATNKIIGIHMICSQAAEMINAGVLAVEYGSQLELLARTSAGHPSFAESWKSAIQDCLKN